MPQDNYNITQITIKDRNRMVEALNILKVELNNCDLEVVSNAYWDRNDGSLYDKALLTFRNAVNYLNPNGKGK